MNSFRSHARSLIVLSLALAALVGTAAPVAAAEPLTEAQKVINIAREQKGDRWAFAATGPNQFDCSGLVTFAFRETGLLDRIGGKRRTVAGFYKYFIGLGKADKVEGKPGDLIVWGRNEHMGIYLGDGMAVSALVNPYGVSVHPVKGYIGMKVKAYLHVDLER
jgi:cell wall-associated NlpC family hydrolase